MGSFGCLGIAGPDVLHRAPDGLVADGLADQGEARLRPPKNTVSGTLKLPISRGAESVIYGSRHERVFGTQRNSLLREVQAAEIALP